MTWTSKNLVTTLRRAALTSRTISTHHIQHLCPMSDCNGKRELVTMTLRRAALTSRTTTTYHIQQLCPMNDCNGKRELVTRALRRAALTSITTTTYHIQQLCPMNDCKLVRRSCPRSVTPFCPLRRSQTMSHPEYWRLADPWPTPAHLVVYISARSRV